MPGLENVGGGINTRVPAHSKELRDKKQCVRLQNFRCRDEITEPIIGTRKFHGTTLGDRVTAIMPYYNDQTDQFVLLAAAGDSIFKRNEATNEFTTLVSALTPNSIYSSVSRHGVLYIASTSDKLKQYTGGLTLDKVGGGDTQAPSFRVIVYMKEIDRLFGISDNAIFGQISWCDLSQPEIWDGASVERIKLKDGEKVEGAEVLYGKLVVFCTYTIWIYYVSGNEENWKLEEAPTSVGCVAPNTIKKDGNRIIFLGESPAHSLGVYAFNGSTSELLTDDISPTLAEANKNKLRNAAAEIHDDMYTLSLALGSSEENDTTFDLDLINLKPDGAPAIYGPHTYGFISSSVLNNRQNSKQFLTGDEDGWVYFENGSTFKSTNGIDGDLIEQSFLSAIHDDDTKNILKQYNDLSLFFRPTAYFNAYVRYFISYGSFSENHNFFPAVVSEGFAGDFDVHAYPQNAIPQLYEFKKYLEMNARGTAIQIEISNNVKTQRVEFLGYDYSFSELHKTERIQSYAV